MEKSLVLRQRGGRPAQNKINPLNLLNDEQLIYEMNKRKLICKFLPVLKRKSLKALTVSMSQLINFM